MSKVNGILWAELISSAPVKDYQMPANEQGLADHISIWGRRRIILRGGNRGVAAAAVDECRVSYGDLKSRCSGRSPHGEGYVSPAS
jgi:hypothetical protein